MRCHNSLEMPVLSGEKEDDLLLLIHKMSIFTGSQRTQNYSKCVKFNDRSPHNSVSRITHYFKARA